MGRALYEASGRRCQKNVFAKRVPRDHGPEASEVAELDLALLAGSEGWSGLGGGRCDGRGSVLTLDANVGSATVIAFECLC